jgi:hypothetical protein
VSPELENARGSILKVGGGRGFVVDLPHPLGGTERAVITAAHCLPHLPPAHPTSYTEERTFADLIGPLGSESAVWAECYFVDPIADLAILGQPDSQELSDEWEAHRTLLDELPALVIAPAMPGPAWRLSLAGEWVAGTVTGVRRGISADWSADVESGMSGSPIIQDGCAVGLVSIGNHFDPPLTRGLPAWVFVPTDTPRSGR